MNIMLRAAVAALLITAGPASAYKLMPAGKSVQVANSGLTVTPSQDWNKMGLRPGRAAESWTLDGLALNDLTFYGAIANDMTLFREVKKSEKPLPHFSASMLPTDIASLFEESYRVANGTSLMSITSVEPATFAGKPGIRFTYDFTVQNEEVRRLGEARGAVIDGKLYLITYEAPIIHFFDNDVVAFRKIADSAFIGALPK